MNVNFNSFQDFIAYVDKNYFFTPTAFKNGNQFNQAGENNGSCKVFAFAQLQQFTKEETLMLFGQYYQEVLTTPNGNDHQNIRNFMKMGWDGIVFEGKVLTEK